MRKIKKENVAMAIAIATLCCCICTVGLNISQRVVWANETKTTAEVANSMEVSDEPLTFEHHESDKYYLLTTNDQLVYDTIVEMSLKILNGEEYNKNLFFTFGIGTVDCLNVYHALEADCAWLIWWATELHWETKDYGSDGFTVNMVSQYDDEDGKIQEEILEKAIASVKMARQFAKSVEGKSVKTQLMLFSNYVAQCTEYNYYTTEHYFDDTEYVLDSKNFISVFDGNDESTSICTGYASAMQLLCYLNGIECYRVYGYINTEDDDHAWNKVIIDDQGYLFDITFADKGDVLDDSYVLTPIDGDKYKIDTDKYVEIANVLAD